MSEPEARKQENQLGGFAVKNTEPRPDQKGCDVLYKVSRRKFYTLWNSMAHRCHPLSIGGVFSVAVAVPGITGITTISNEEETYSLPVLVKKKNLFWKPSAAISSVHWK